MKKKGQLVYKSIIVSIIGIILIISFLSAGKLSGSGEKHYLSAVAKDISLLINTLYALPGEASITYPRDVNDYIITIQGTTVGIGSEAGLSVATAKYKLTGRDIGSITIVKPDSLTFHKKKDETNNWEITLVGNNVE